MDLWNHVDLSADIHRWSPIPRQFREPCGPQGLLWQRDEFATQLGKPSAETTSGNGSLGLVKWLVNG